MAWSIVAVLAVVLGASFPYFEGFMNANERPRLLQGMAMIDEGTMAIDGPAARGIDPGIDISRAPGRRLYPNKPPGASVPAAVAYGGLRLVARAGGEPVTLRTYTLWARVLGGLVPTLLLCWLVIRRYRHALGEAPVLAAVALYACATPVSAYARLLFGHQLAACLLFVGVTLVIDAHNRAGKHRLALAFAGGLCAAAAVTVEYAAVFAGIPVAALLLSRVRHKRGLGMAAATLAGALVPIGLLAGYHAAAFGSPWTSGYHHVVRDEFAAIHGAGLLGLQLPSAASLYQHLLSPWGGLFVWAPLCIVGLLGLLPSGKSGFSRSLEGRMLLATFVTLLVVNLGLAQTGGWRVGPRYLVAAMPLMIPGLALAVREAATRPRWFGAIVALATWSTLANFLAANLFPHLIPVGNPLGDFLVPIWRLGLEPYNLFRSLLGLEHHALWGVLVVTVAAVAVPLWYAGPMKSERARIWGVGVAAGILLTIAASTTSDTPDAAANLAAAERVWEPNAGQPLRASRALEPMR